MRVPISGSSATVTDGEGVAVASQVLPITPRERALSLLYLQFSEMGDKSKVTPPSRACVCICLCDSFLLLALG